ncbi:nuclear factor related to kappa-B-binding protein-like isoform X2 [Mercenaria mercenaria]|uniref:nuclear factor related to kappa-B-binding protein-like isoform X2 n=1 Tax=Mercenaria mercenaria TaxID=6596 RepID=UPI00234E5F1B|nr:nuclear factor related to kappa-B-binding protein-like isoform X2 [Mercenaria mercenaria]
METSKWQPGYLPKTGKLERCLLGSEEIQVPECFLEQKHIFHSVMSQETWNKVLTESQRQHLMTFLPKFPEKENEERRDTLRKLFNGENFKFGNPLQKFQYQLKDGSFSPDIAKYSNMIRRMKHQEYRNKQKRYYHNLLKEILLSRQRVFDQLTELPPDEPIKFEYEPPKQQKESPLKQKVQRKYKRYLDEVRKECGADEISSDEDDGSPVDRSKQQLFKSLNPVPSPEPVTPSVHSTYAAKLEYVNGDVDTPAAALKRPRPISPPEITEDTYREMLIKHRRRQLYDDYDEEEHPEYNTQNISLQDVMARCQASRKGGTEPDDDDLDFPLMSSSKGKVKKEKTEKRVRKKTAKKIRDMDFSAASSAAAAAGDADDDDDESRTNVSIDITEDDTSTVDQFPVQTSKTKDDLSQCPSFFSLLKNIIVHSPDNRISAVKLEERVRDWQESPFSDECAWVSAQDDWVDLVISALKFLAGETIGLNVDQFIPYLDYKERAQQWHWIGVGRDSDENLLKWCNHWLKHKGEVSELIIDPIQGSPPPARIRTGYVVKATSEDEKADFQRQEKLRFAEPHKAFTYEMHGYQSVVGPVKGVFSKKNDTNRAREHALLVSSRPAFITILTLVRDAVARLPNGEGNRAEICELLKDSQFLAPGITDAQINVVVSGALDRLHSEKDPCVKYDVNSKVWIYLHRNRTEEEFEKIHQAQAAAQKAKKSLAKQKTAKTTAPKLRDMAAAPSGSTSSLSLAPSLGSSSESINVEDVSPGQLGSQAQLLAGTAAPAVKVSARQSSVSSKTAGVTQSLTPAQLQLLQQAAAAQAAHVKAQAEAQAAKAQAQAQAQATGKGQGKGQGASPKLDLANKVQNVTINQQGQVKVIPQTTSIASVVKGTAPPNVTIQTKPELQTIRQTSVATGQTEGPSSPAVQVITTATKTVTVATSSGVGSPVTVISSMQAGTNPLVARLMQQMSAGGQMVSVSSLLAAQRSLQQGNQPRGTAAFKIQGGNVLQQVSPGKPVQLAGKPLAHAKGQLVQLGGKGQQALGVIQTPQGTINIIPQGAAQGGVVTISQPKTAGTLETKQSGSPVLTTISQSAATQGALGQILGQSKSSTTNPGGVMVTQLTSGGSITLRPTGSHGKVITQGQPGLVPAQLILQPPTGSLKTVEAQSGADTTVSGSGVTPQSPSLQMVRTVLSQQAGLKAGQATILISQPALQQGQVLPPGHLVQHTRSQGKTTQQGKPVFARIINPGSVKLAAGVQGFPTQGPLIHTVGPTGQTISVQSDAALRQTLSKLVTGASPGSPANVILTTVGSSGTSASPGSPANVILGSSGTSITSSQQILAAAAAGKAAQIKEMEKEKKS